uniref:Dehydrogenase/reductase SDR member 1 n=1 Tax=Sphaerodactylus townsendi TaxID=933632 RepID=A0ACB8GCR6_9SAUR
MAESIEVSGKCVVGLATNPNILHHSGKVLLSPELAQRYQFKDVDGKDVFNYTSLRNILIELMPKCLDQYLNSYTTHMLNTQYKSPHPSQNPQ